MKYPSRRFPFVERGTTREIEEPFRRGASIVARIPFTRQGLVVGRWSATAMTEDEALRQAIGLRELDVA